MDIKYDVVIFGAGIAGLTVAHELSKYNLKIAIVEKENIIGGMARSSRYDDNMPTEHSWRGFGPFYKNTFNIMKDINYNNNSVYDTLIKKINFIYPENSINLNKDLSFYDIFIFAYYIIYHLLSGNLRSEENKNISFTKSVESNLTTNAKNKYITSIGPGIGLDTHSASIFHVGKYIEMMLFETYDKEWFFMDQPTSEGWFDPWQNYLKNKGVNHLDITINFKDGSVLSYHKYKEELKKIET